MPADKSSFSSKIASRHNPLELTVFWVVIYLIESFLICFGNSLSIVVFWRRRRSLKRTSYLLINLAVADLSLGVSTAAHTVVRQLWPRTVKMPYVMSKIILLVTFASIFSLTLVSLETTYAVVFPFRHRTTGRRAYFFALILTWLLAALPCVLWIILPLFNFDFLFLFGYIAVAIAGVCLILISFSYSLIWCSVSKRRNRERDQRKKLAVTLFIVTVLSLMTWIPGQLGFLSHFVEALQSESTGAILRAVLMSNSFLNPLVYTFRLPEFRNEIKLILHKPSWCKSEPRAAASSPPACNLVSMSIIGSAQEMRVPKSPCDSKQRNGNNAEWTSKM